MTHQSNRRKVIQRIAGLGTAIVFGLNLNLAIGQTGGGAIKVGMTGSLTGPYSEYGEAVKNALDLAIEQWNARGGINGRKIELTTVLDDQLIPDRAAQNMRRLLDDKSLDVIMGPGGSGPSLAVADMVAADGRTFINPFSQNPTPTYPNGLDKPPRANMFQFGILSNVEAEFLGNYLGKTYKKIGLAHESTGYGVAGKDTLLNIITKKYPDRKFEIESYAQRSTDVTSQLLRLQRAEVDAIVVVGLGADLVNIRRTMRRIGMQQPLIASAGGVSVAYMEGAGDAAAGTIAPLVGALVESNPRPEVTAFVSSYKAKYGPDRQWGPDKDRPFAGMSLIVIPPYDGANIVFEGIRRANSTEPAKVTAAIESMKDVAGVNTVYSFSRQRHHGIDAENLTMLQAVKRGDKVVWEVLKN